MASPPLKMLPIAASLAVVFVLCNIGPTPARARSTDKEQYLKGIWKRATDEDSDHGHDDDHAHIEPENQLSCAITDHVLAHEFTELAEKMMLTDHDGEPCHIEEEGEEHGEEHDEEHEHEEEHAHEVVNGTASSNLTCSSCTAIYDFVQALLLRLNVTTPCCLGDNSTCSPADPEGSRTTDPAKAYGYGFLMVILISSCSLLGVALLPLLNKDSKCHGLYKYIYFLMIALGTSALFCDAILHLLPEAFGLHNHGAGEDHAHEEEEEDRSYIWKGIIVICGLYLFYLFEVALHSMNSHSHGHHHHHELSQLQSNSESDEPNFERDVSSSETNLDTPLTKVSEKPSISSSTAPCLEPTLPHGACRDKTSEEVEMQSGAILHPGQKCDETNCAVSAENKKDGCKICSIRIKPIAWVIILGDAIHNFADGLALGAAISQSLSLGVSTMIAIVFHELPHELGDFTILLSTGLKWYVALLFNFVSSLTAVLGFFVGVAVGTASSEANSWILAAAAGVFLYIALVDLLPELIHINEKGFIRLALIIMANIGFVISFVVLLVIAIYEEELNTLISV